MQIICVLNEAKTIATPKQIYYNPYWEEISDILMKSAFLLHAPPQNRVAVDAKRDYF